MSNSNYTPRFAAAETNTDAKYAARIVADQRSALVGQTREDWLRSHEADPIVESFSECAEYACAAIKDAVKDGVKIGVWGDYDADGSGAAIIIKEELEKLGATTHCQLANRADGYGFQAAHVQRFSDSGCAMVIVCDAGTSDIKSIELARELGIQTVVVDHHKATAKGTADADFILNYHAFEGDLEPEESDLCSSGMALLLVNELTGFRASDSSYELAAIATVADMMDLTPVNRTIVSRGLRSLHKTERPGLRALMNRKGIKDRVPTSTDIGFSIGPCINAPGRIGDTSTLIQLLASTDEETAAHAAKTVDDLNEERKAQQRKAMAEARASAIVGKYCVVVSSQGWSPGIVGPIAGNLSREHSKAAFVMGRAEDGRRKGSCRAPEGLSVVDAMEYASEQLGHRVVIRFGGHSAAGGFTIKVGHERDFLDTLDEYFKGIGASVERKPVEYDGFLQLHHISISTCEVIGKLGPFSPEFGCNPEPVWIHRNAQVTSVSGLGGTGDHSQLGVVGMYDGFEQLKRVVAFFRPITSLGVEAGDRADIAYTASVTHWRGRPEVQLKLVDLWKL